MTNRSFLQAGNSARIPTRSAVPCLGVPGSMAKAGIPLNFRRGSGTSLRPPYDWYSGKEITDFHGRQELSNGYIAIRNVPVLPSSPRGVIDSLQLCSNILENCWDQCFRASRHDVAAMTTSVARQIRQVESVKRRRHVPAHI